ncbi:acid protease [Rickenella mellea]|uniref:Acid protease n=1 Tax=Rickenella mellea TaxID=50990 RepID=A0A4Y7PDV8_9AGAM|nr:acid protease [Rickenella mellea]
MVDTGSGLTWVHGDRQQFHAQAPSASHPASAWNGKDFQSVYARGSASGNLRDVFEVIGVAASHSIGDIGADGLLGLGPKALTAQLGTYAHPIPTVIDTFNAKEKEANANAKEIFGIYFEPWSVPGGKGHLSFGDVDKSSIKGDITWVDFLQTPELRDYYGFEMSVQIKLSYSYKHKGSTGNIELLKNDEGNEKVHGLTDTGSTLILLDPAMFETYHQAIGAEWDFRTKLWRLTIENYEKLGDLIFKIGGRDFKFAPEAQVFPLAWNVAQRGSSSGVATHRWLTIGPAGQMTKF